MLDADGMHVANMVEYAETRRIRMSFSGFLKKARKKPTAFDAKRE